MNKDYKKVNTWCFNNIKEAVDILFKYKSKGILAKLNFNEVWLYSDTVTLDNAYKEITGKSKKEFEDDRKQWLENLEKQKIEHKNKIPELAIMWEQKGREVLSGNKWKLWDEIVPIRLNDLYQGIELGNCLDIVKILNNGGTIEDAKKEIENQNHSGMSFGLVCSMVNSFCDRGKEFVEYIR